LGSDLRSRSRYSIPVSHLHPHPPTMRIRPPKQASCSICQACVACHVGRAVFHSQYILSWCARIDDISASQSSSTVSKDHRCPVGGARREQHTDQIPADAAPPLRLCKPRKRCQGGGRTLPASRTSMTRDGMVAKSSSVTSDRFLHSSSLSSSTPALDDDVSFSSDMACNQPVDSLLQ
jgi:hypothetical protein